MKEIQGQPVICYREKEGDSEQNWKIALPTKLIDSTIKWYHEVLGHGGATRLYDTIRERFYVPGLKQACMMLRCDECQKQKQIGISYGHLPPRHALLLP